MMNRYFALVPVTCLFLFAQTPPPTKPAEDVKPPDLADTQPDTLIERSTVSVVQAPVTVTDRDGSLVSGLRPNEFHLFDNGKEQNIRVDIAFQPISLVI